MSNTNWKVIEKILDVSSRVLLWGPPATGKTLTPILRAQKRGRDVYVVTLTPETPAGDLMGRYLLRPTPQGPVTEFVEGPVTRICRNPQTPSTLVINEIDHAGPDVTSILHPVLESATSGRLLLPDGSPLQIPENLQVVASMNSPPETLLESLRSRLPVQVHIDQPHPGVFKAIPAPYKTIAQELWERHDTRKWNAFLEMVDAGLPPEAFDILFGEDAYRVREAAVASEVTA